MPEPGTLTLEWGVVLLVLLSAVLHASWNALMKSSGDPLLNLTVISAAGGLAAACALPLLPFPARESWPFLASSAVLHFLYAVSLIRAYGIGDLSQVYPIARGLAPLGVAALAALVAAEIPGPRQALGLLLASAAVVSLGWIGRHRAAAGPALRRALVTAFLISIYTTVDGLGARSAGSPFSYVAWLSFLDAFPMLALVFALRRDAIRPFLAREGARTALAGVLATLGYAVVLWAISRGAMATVAALRETGVVFAAWIGTQLLGEPFGRERMLAALLLAGGLALVQL